MSKYDYSALNKPRVGVRARFAIASLGGNRGWGQLLTDDELDVCVDRIIANSEVFTLLHRFPNVHKKTSEVLKEFLSANGLTHKTPDGRDWILLVPK